MQFGCKQDKCSNFSELFSKSSQEIKLGLGNIKRACTLLSLREGLAPCILIAGTNGKGSTAGILWHLFAASGISSGLFTSPHICNFRERIQLSHANTDDKYLYDSWVKIKSKLPLDLYEELSFFELSTLIALIIFKEKKTKINILEVGLGGRLDATNIVDPIASAVVSIGFDHQEYLGYQLNKIACEKLAIGRKGRPLFWGMSRETYDDQLAQVLQEQTNHLKFIPIKKSKHFFLEKERIYLNLPEHAPFSAELPQSMENFSRVIKENFSLALAMYYWTISNHAQFSKHTETVKETMSRSLRYFGHRKIKWPNTLIARFQFLNVQDLKKNIVQPIILDVCHNIDSVSEFCRSIKRACLVRGNFQKIPGIVSILKDKDIEGMLNLLREVLDPLVLFEVNNKRSIKKQYLQGSNSVLPLYTSFRLAWSEQQNKVNDSTLPVAICGSFYAIGEVFDFFHAYYKEKKLVKDLSGNHVFTQGDLCR